MKLKLLTTFLLIIFLQTTSFGQTIWKGTTNTDWNNADNWSPKAVPAASDDVLISTNSINRYPTITAITANVKSLTINPGATLTLANNSNTVLNISGDFANNGTFTATGTASVVNFNGANQNVAAATYSNLTLSGSGTKTFGAITTIRNLLAISTNVIANLGAVEHRAGILTLGGAGPLSASWGSTSSNPVAKNTNNTFFASSSGIITIKGPAPGSAIDNNYASYTSGVSDEVWGSIGENDGKLTLSAPPGSAFINVKFASYGIPTGTAPAFKIGSCHAFNSRTVTTGLLGSNVATVPASGSFNNTFGDPCYGVLKSYNVVATYAQPFCTVGGAVPSFVINGSPPTGGNGGYTYLWEISTTSPTTGYTSVSGTNNEKDYRVSENTITKTTWFRRTVTSGIYTDATIVIVQVVSEVPVKPTTFKSVTDNCKGTATLTVSGGSVGGLGGYAEFYSDACGGTVVGTSNSIPASIEVSPTTGNTTYYVKYKNSCDVTECSSIVVTQPTVSISAGGSATPVCVSTTSQNASLSYTATVGTPTKFNVIWDTAGKMAGLKDQGDTAFAFSETGGTLNTIAVPATVRAGTYTGTLTVKNNSSCVSFKNIFTVTITPSVAINTFSPASSNRCQEAGNFVATTTATNSSGITYSLDSTTKAFSGNSIDASSGAITFAAGWFGTTTITATAAGCNGPKTTTYVITTTANAAVPVANASTAIDCTSVTANWSASANATSYELDLATDIGFANMVAGYPLNVDNVVTKLITGLHDGTFYYRIRAKYSCGGKDVVTANSSTINFTTMSPVGGLISSPQNICYNSRPANLLLTGYTGSIIRWESANDIMFLTGVVTYNVEEINLPENKMIDLKQNTYFRAVVRLSECIAYSAPVLITVSSQEPAPTIVNVIQPTCANSKASVELGNLPLYGMIYRSGPGTSGKFYPLTGGVTQTIVGLDAGTYSFSIKSGSILQCSTKATADVVITAPITKTWNGSSWSGNSEPTIDNAVVFTGDYSSTKDLFGCSCTVNKNAKVTIKEGKTLTIANAVTVFNEGNENEWGSLTFENNASLVQTANVATNQNIGKINYKRTSAEMKNLDYTYWSSPVVGQTIKKLSPNTAAGDYFKWTANDWDSNVDVMNRGVGYIIRVPRNWPESKQSVAFTGVPHNGTFEGEVVVAGQNNLIGNPYPSAISADKFIEANKNLIDGALYFWTHNTARALNDNGTAYVYKSDDYAIYSVVGGVATAKSAKTDPGGSDGGKKPSGNIAAGQSFFARGIGSGPITFNNDMRVVANNAQFFKMTQSKGELSKSRIWLNLSNERGAFKQILVGYLDGATDGYESQFDAKSLNGNSFVNFYSLLNTAKFSIQGRALPFSDSDEIPLGYSSTVAGEYTIDIDEADGDLLNQVVYLEDKLLNMTYNLRKGGYVFTTARGVFNDRFLLRYNSSTLGVDDFESNSKELVVSIKNKVLKVNANSEIIGDVVIYDTTGKRIYMQNEINKTFVEISNLSCASQVLLVKIILENGAVETRKVLFD